MVNKNLDSLKIYEGHSEKASVGLGILLPWN